MKNKTNSTYLLFYFLTGSIRNEKEAAGRLTRVGGVGDVLESKSGPTRPPSPKCFVVFV